ncbi:hypothetical protein BGX34_006138, partial [Mortierella sp. NVP85]
MSLPWSNSRPTYAGVMQTLPEGTTRESYFSDTAVKDWSLEGGLIANICEDAFFETLKLLSKSKKLPVALRAHALSLMAYYNGPLGHFRKEIDRRAARNALSRVVLTMNEHAVAQQQLDGVLGDEL